MGDAAVLVYIVRQVDEGSGLRDNGDARAVRTQAMYVGSVRVFVWLERSKGSNSEAGDVVDGCTGVGIVSRFGRMRGMESSINS